MEEPPVIAFALVDEGVVDVGDRRRGKRHAHLAREIHLDGKVVPVIVLHRGGRFYLEHSPSPLVIAAPGRQHHIGEGKDAVVVEGRLKDRALACFQEHCGKPEGLVIAERLPIDERPVPLWIENLTRDIANFVADLEDHLRR